jgi:hypothetical protein
MKASIFEAWEFHRMPEGMGLVKLLLLHVERYAVYTRFRAHVPQHDAFSRVCHPGL